MGLEELYNHQTDPNEWHNVAYKSKNKKVIEKHRKVLLEMLPELKWEIETPKGYTITKNGNIFVQNYSELSVSK